VRPLPKLFDAQAIRDLGGQIMGKTGGVKLYKGNTYKHGFLYKKVPIISLMIDGVNPTIDEMERFQARMVAIRKKLLDFLPNVLSDICIAYLSILYAPLDDPDSSISRSSSSSDFYPSSPPSPRRPRALSNPEAAASITGVTLILPNKSQTPQSVHRSFTFSPITNTKQSLFPKFPMLDEDGKVIIGLDEEIEEDEKQTSVLVDSTESSWIQTQTLLLPTQTTQTSVFS